MSCARRFFFALATCAHGATPVWAVNNSGTQNQFGKIKPAPRNVTQGTTSNQNGTNTSLPARLTCAQIT